MKKILCFVLVIILTFTFSVSAFAASGDFYTSVDTHAMYGILTSDEGEAIIIEGKLCNSNNQLGMNANALTYEFAVPALASPTNGSTTIDAPDSAYVSRVYLTISYSMRNTPTEYKLTRVSGRWTIEDPRVSVTSSSLTYGCSGLFPSVVTQTGSREHLSNPFSINTGFTSYVVGDYCAVMGAHLTLTYLMGTSRTWTFTIDNMLFNN